MIKAKGINGELIRVELKGQNVSIELLNADDFEHPLQLAVDYLEAKAERYLQADYFPDLFEGLVQFLKDNGWQITEQLPPVKDTEPVPDDAIF
jgi:hypothetical protein